MATTPSTSSSAPLTISNSKPDFDSILLQLQLFVKARGSWNDLLTQSTGQTLLEAAAAVGAFNQQGVEIAFREAFFTAVRDSSVYAITSMLGVRLSRKAPAVVSVKLKRTNSSVDVIPEMSQFTVGGMQFYNRNNIVFNSDTMIVSLYEGQVKTKVFQGDTTPFREVLLGEPNFVVSNIDVKVKVANTTTNQSVPWSKSHDGIWLVGPNETVFQDFTNGSGDVILRFGNGEHGAIPGLGYSIVVDYAVTSGSAGNNGGTGLPVAYPADSSVTGITQNAVAGGADEKSAEFYRAVAPYIFRSKNRAVTSTDYRAIALSYPDVASVIVQTQKDIAPNDLRWMNVVRICVLPDSAEQFNEQQWLNFEKYMLSRVHAAVHLQLINPTKIKVNITIRVAVTANARPSDVENLVRVNIQTLFARDSEALGRKITQSDLIEAANISGVDYVELVSPKQDLMPLSPLSWFSAENVNITTFITERRFSKN